MINSLKYLILIPFTLSAAFSEEENLKISCGGTINLHGNTTFEIKQQEFNLSKLEDPANPGDETYSVRARLATEDKKYGIRLRATLRKVEGEYKSLSITSQFERKEADNTIKVLAIANGRDVPRTKDSAGQVLDRVFIMVPIRLSNPEFATLIVNSDKNADKAVESGILSKQPMTSEDMQMIVPADMASDASLTCVFLD